MLARGSAASARRGSQAGASPALHSAVIIAAAAAAAAASPEDIDAGLAAALAGIQFAPPSPPDGPAPAVPAAPSSAPLDARAAPAIGDWATRAGNEDARPTAAELLAATTSLTSPVLDAAALADDADRVERVARRLRMDAPAGRPERVVTERHSKEDMWLSGGGLYTEN